MNALVDINLLLAVGWESHEHHREAKAWLTGVKRFATCAITELGFLRVSMSPGYRAEFSSAVAVMAAIRKLNSAVFLAGDISIEQLPVLPRYQETTDAWLVALARQHNLQFATLDEALIRQTWARGVAFNPIRLRKFI